MTPVDQVVAWVLEDAELPKQKAPLRVTVHQGKPSYTISGEPVFSWYVEIWRQVTRGKSKGEWVHVFNGSGSTGDRNVAIRAARRVSETLGLGGKFFWTYPHADERDPGLGRGWENPPEAGDAFDALYHEVYAILRSDDLEARRPLLEAIWPEYVYAERPDQENDYFVNIWGEYHWPERYGKARLPLMDLSVRLRRAVVAGVL